MLNGRKPQSKVNRLKQQVETLNEEVNHYSNVSASIIHWVYDNCSEEQKEQFGEFIHQLTKDLEG